MKICLYLSLITALCLPSCRQYGENNESGGTHAMLSAESMEGMCSDMMENPQMINAMMDCMMRMSAKDSAMSRMMCVKMMENPQMMNMMRHMMGDSARMPQRENK